MRDNFFGFAHYAPEYLLDDIKMPWKGGVEYFCTKRILEESDSEMLLYCTERFGLNPDDPDAYHRKVDLIRRVERSCAP